MAYSKVDICNIALGFLGAAAIRDFDEANKRARMCDVFFDQVSGYMLSKNDWPFARKFVKLNELVLPTGKILPDGFRSYGLPTNCKIPRDIHPRGSRVAWEQVEQTIQLVLQGDVFLYYTANDISVAQFSDGFATVVATGMAARMCMPITQDKALTKELKDQFRLDFMDVAEVEANIGNEQKAHDDIPENDTFVNPPGGQVQYVDPRYPNW